MKNLRKLFGTDGIRGVANKDLTAELALKAGKAGAKFLIADGRKGKIIVGKDPRPSGDFIESALVAGILSSGHDVLRTGIISTPAVALLVKILDLDGGIMISASHNPLGDNGIKFFSKGGLKLTDEQEKNIEHYMLMIDGADNSINPTGTNVGRCSDLNDACDIYLNYIIENFNIDLKGLKIAVDCANGSCSVIVPKALNKLGAEVLSFNTGVTGENINDNCGSTHPEHLQKIVLKSRADIGFSYDGDGDRVIACDSKGRILNGDVIMALCAIGMSKNGKLKNNYVVTTIMANMGFDIAMEQEGIKVYKTEVGDRYVLEKMLAEDCALGGEQSGHIIFKDLSTTGDGLISTLEFLEMIINNNYNIDEIHKVIPEYPQILKNVKVKNKKEIMNCNYVKVKIAEIEEKLKGDGRIVVRPSGTEPVVRVMAEAKTLKMAEEAVDELVVAIAECGNKS